LNCFGPEGFLPIRILRRKKGMLLLNAAFYEFSKSDEFYLINLDVTPGGGIRN
jgi:hypothetical protein